MKPRKGELDVLRALEKFCEKDYDGYLTLEMNKVQGLEDFRTGLKLMKQYS